MLPTSPNGSDYVVFQGERLLAHGPLEAVLTRAKSAWDKDPEVQLLFLDESTGRGRDFDLRGSLAQVLARGLPPKPALGRGRPRLGVLSREISLLPRHWDWLEQQPQGASAALRRLVDAARQAEPNRALARRAREALDRSLLALAGDRPGYEEALRALYQRDLAAFKRHSAAWPPEIRRYAQARAQAAEALENGAPA